MEEFKFTQAFYNSCYFSSLICLFISLTLLCFVINLLLFIFIFYYRYLVQNQLLAWFGVINLVSNIVSIERLVEHQTVLTYLVETSRHIGRVWVPHTFPWCNLTPELVLGGRRPSSLSIKSKKKKGFYFLFCFPLKINKLKKWRLLNFFLRLIIFLIKKILPKFKPSFS